MHSKSESCAACAHEQLSRIDKFTSLRRGSTVVQASSGLLATVFCLFAGGCASTSATKPVKDFSAALAPVVDQATAAYQAANSIHDASESYLAANAFDKTDPVYNPRDGQPLLTQAQIDARLAVLKGLQLYVQSLTAVTSGTESPALDAAARQAGGSLTALANAEAPAIEGALGIVVAPASKTTTTTTTTTGNTTTSTTSSASQAAPLISKQAQFGFSTGINALGQFLISRKVKEELPGIVKTMDPQVKALCDLMSSEIDTLASQEKIDFDTVIDEQTLFLRLNKSMDAEERRAEIMKLPGMARQQQTAAQQLAQLKVSIEKLEKAHHDLAMAVQENKPESIKDRMGELVTAGRNLGKFYSSLSSPAPEASAGSSKTAAATPEN